MNRKQRNYNRICGPVFFREAAGRAAFGLIIAVAVKKLIKLTENMQIEILFTLALVMGGYALAIVIQVSGQIAISTAGIIIGSNQREFFRTQEERNYERSFWEVMDWITLTVIFIIHGMEIFVVPMSLSLFFAGITAVTDCCSQGGKCCTFNTTA